MTLGPAHGNAAKGGALAVVERAALDALPAGVPAPAPPVADRHAAGEFRPGPGTSALAATGGHARAVARAEAARFGRLLGVVELDDEHAYSPYLRLAREHREDHALAVAADVGGGQLSPGVSSIIASASLALAASRYLYDLGAKTCSPKLLGQAAQMAERSRTALLTAHELAAREAQGRPRRNPVHDRILGAGREPTEPGK